MKKYNKHLINNYYNSIGYMTHIATTNTQYCLFCNLDLPIHLGEPHCNVNNDLQIKTIQSPSYYVNVWETLQLIFFNSLTYNVCHNLSNYSIVCGAFRYPTLVLI